MISRSILWLVLLISTTTSTLAQRDVNTFEAVVKHVEDQGQAVLDLLVGPDSTFHMVAVSKTVTSELGVGALTYFRYDRASHLLTKALVHRSNCHAARLGLIAGIRPFVFYKVFADWSAAFLSNAGEIVTELRAINDQVAWCEDGLGGLVIVSWERPMRFIKIANDLSVAADFSVGSSLRSVSPLLCQMLASGEMLVFGHPHARTIGDAPVMTNEIRLATFNLERRELVREDRVSLNEIAEVEAEGIDLLEPYLVKTGRQYYLYSTIRSGSMKGKTVRIQIDERGIVKASEGLGKLKVLREPSDIPLDTRVQMRYAKLEPDFTVSGLYFVAADERGNLHYWKRPSSY